MSLHSQLRGLGGVARTPTLLSLGVSRHTIVKSLTQARIVRVKRGWVALPDADPVLVTAARNSVVISCISRAKRLGLWVFKEEQTHVASKPNGAPLTDPHFIVHRHRPISPRHPDHLEDSLVNTLALVAACMPHEEAVAIWDSALNKKLTDVHTLQQFPLPSRAQKVLGDTTPLTDSGIESYLRQRLAWLPATFRLQIWLLGHRVDALVGERLVIQADGGHHIGPQRDSDNKHDAVLRLAGYTVIRVSYRQLVHEWPKVQELITSAIAQGLHKNVSHP